mmetsp:Transcript_2114/g.4797  ORF Transcript_2114/g.4797 Transcript_2114/m.4797 type:complete len:216 (-) Transcript_2114:176-823(-)
MPVGLCAEVHIAAVHPPLDLQLLVTLRTVSLSPIGLFWRHVDVEDRVGRYQTTVGVLAPLQRQTLGSRRVCDARECVSVRYDGRARQHRRLDLTLFLPSVGREEVVAGALGEVDVFAQEGVYQLAQRTFTIRESDSLDVVPLVLETGGQPLGLRTLTRPVESLEDDECTSWHRSHTRGAPLLTMYTPPAADTLHQIARRGFAECLKQQAAAALPV